MFWRILKKDLKRKKTMNIILLLFVILCSMFAAASVNNIIAVTGGIEHYFDVSSVPDAVVEIWGENDAEEKIGKLASISEIKTQHCLYGFSSKCFTYKGKKLDNFINPARLISDDEMGIKYFDEENNVIKSVDKGYFYCTSQFLQNIDIEKGDEVELEIGECRLTLKYMGRLKGALFSSDSSSSPTLIINSDDYDCLDKNEADYMSSYKMLYIRTADISAVRAIATEYDEVYVSTRAENKDIYLYDMLAAYIMMTISIVLMITAFVVQRFTIGFTISEEFREIGVMKAVGIDNGSIRSLYIVKYLVIAVTGSVIGFFCSIPLGHMMMKTISENMVLGSESSTAMGLISSAAVIIIILLFCYGCTRRVKKFSPIDAVRNGQTGERFGKKSLLHLGRSKLPATVFLSFNDILSAPKRFGIITVIFTLCMLMMTMMSNVALTLKSEKILWLFGVPSSEVHIFDSETLGKLFAEQDAYKELISDTEKLLADNDMPGRCTITIGTNCEASHNDKTAKILFEVTKGDTDDTPRIDEGSAPQKKDEIAMTISALNDLDAQIGDRIWALIDGRRYEFIITGRYSSFSSPSAKLYKDFDLGGQPLYSTMGVQIHFDGEPDKETLNNNIEKIKELIGSDKVYSTSGMIKELTGMSDTLNAIKQMMMILTVIVTAMIVILMERSFISKEKSEIALMKAVGIPDRSIIAQHTLRFVIVSILACLLSTAVLMPLSNAMMNWMCSMVGDVAGISCAIDPVEIFLICPAILIGVTVIGSFLTALYTKTIKASDTANIE